MKQVFPFLIVGLFGVVIGVFGVIIFDLLRQPKDAYSSIAKLKTKTVEGNNISLREVVDKVFSSANPSRDFDIYYIPESLGDKKVQRYYNVGSHLDYSLVAIRENFECEFIMLDSKKLIFYKSEINK